MALSLDDQIKRVMAKKVIARTTAIYQGVVLDLYKRITANSMQVAFAYGSPVLTGRFYASHTISVGRIDKAVKPPNPEGDEEPYKGLPISNAAAILTNFKLGNITYIANSLPYAQKLEDGYSMKAPEGVYALATEQVKAAFRTTVSRTALTKR